MLTFRRTHNFGARLELRFFSQATFLLWALLANQTSSILSKGFFSKKFDVLNFRLASS